VLLIFAVQLASIRRLYLFSWQNIWFKTIL